MKIQSVGVDLGGTWLRVCALGARGSLLRDVRRPAPPPDLLGGALRRLWREWRVPRVPSLVVGSKGVWKQKARKRMSQSLMPLAEKILVMSDVELAHRALFGEKPGLLVLAGTGSIALARDARGRWSRAGGLGPAKGDEGSGFWIGREYMRSAGKKIPPITPRSVRETAALAEKVLRASARDTLCAGIVREAQSHLMKLVRGLLSKVSEKTPGIGCAGSLFQNGRFRRQFFRRLRAGSPAPNFHVAGAARRPAARAAALLGLRHGSKKGGRYV